MKLGEKMTKEEDMELWAYYQADFDKIGKSEDNIVIVEKFLDEDHRVKILDYLNTHRDDSEFSGGKTLRRVQVLDENQEVADLLKFYEKKLFEVAKTNFTDRYGVKLFEDPWNELHFVKWSPSMGSGLHSDCQYPNGDPLMKSSYYKLNITALIYPNDDYTGGHIQFPDYDLDIKPGAGDLVMFPANNYYGHIVTEVEDGIRYTMPIWWTFDNGAPERRMNYNPNDSKGLWVNEGGDTSHLRSY
jgi:hypothetical protein